MALACTCWEKTATVDKVCEDVGQNPQKQKVKSRPLMAQNLGTLTNQGSG